jgi:glycosyltransferase involved in cell wall biosynthesis
MLALAKYLDKDKYDITVLTLDDKEHYDSKQDEIDNVIYLSNKTFIKKANFNKKTCKFVHYTKAFYNRMLMYWKMDEYSGWTKLAINTLIKLTEEKPIDCIISSFPPVGTMQAAFIFKKNYPQVKWVCDMRDAMSWSPRWNYLVRQYLAKKEREYLGFIDALIAVSTAQLDAYRIHFSRNNLRFLEVRNGFDFDVEKLMLPQNKAEVFHILFAGTFYGAINPENFLSALSSVLFDEPKINIKVTFLGSTKPVSIPDNLRGVVSIEPKIPYFEAVKKMRCADLLLLILPQSLEKGVYSGKIFDYLGVMRPILGLVPPDDVAAELIREANAGYIAPNEDIAAIKQTILQAYTDWKTKKKLVINKTVVEQQHRKNQVKKLEVLLEEILM